MMAKGKPATWADELLHLAKVAPKEPEADPLPEPDGTLPGLIAALDQLNRMPGAKPEATRPEQRDYMSHLLVTLMKQLMATVQREPGAPAINAILALALALDSIDTEGKAHPLFKPEEGQGGRPTPTDYKVRRAFVTAALGYLQGIEVGRTAAAETLAGMVGVKTGTILSDLNKATHDPDALTRDTAKGIVIDSDERLAAAVDQLKDLFTRR
jgi:hypothetical protein